MSTVATSPCAGKVEQSAPRPKTVRRPLPSELYQPSDPFDAADLAALDAWHAEQDSKEDLDARLERMFREGYGRRSEEAVEQRGALGRVLVAARKLAEDETLCAASLVVPIETTLRAVDLRAALAGFEALTGAEVAL